MGKKKKFDKIERNETYYEAYGDEEKKPKKKLFNFDSVKEPEKEKLSSKFTYKREKKPVATDENETIEQVSIPDVRVSPFVFVLIVLCLVFAMRSLLSGGLLSGLAYEKQLGAELAMYVCAYIVPCAMFMAISYKRMKFHYAKPFSPKMLGFSAACLGLVLSVTALQKYIIAYVFAYSEPTTTVHAGVLASLLAGALMPAICEELFVHGILQREVSEYAGGFAGIVVSAFVFSIMHFELQYFLVYFVAAVIMGVLTHITRSCFPAMLVHFLNNALSIIFSQRLGFIATERIGGTLLMIVIAAVCFGFLILCLNIAEKISEKRAEISANDDENGTNTHIEYFFAHDGKTFTRFLNVLKTPPMLICYVIFITAIVLNIF